MAGFPADVIEQMTEGDRAAEVVEVHEDNVEALRVFLELQTQWRVAVGMRPVWMGLEYASIRPVLWGLAIPRDRHRELFAALRVMERAALPILNKPREET